MIFAGDQDLICNYVGLENMMQSMTWNGETGLGVGLDSLQGNAILTYLCRPYKHNRGLSTARQQVHG